MTMQSEPLRVEPDWNDVLVRSTQIVRRRRQRVLLATAVVVGLAAIGGPALAAAGWLDSIFQGSPVSPVALSPSEIQALQTLSVRGKAMPLGLIGALPEERRAALRKAGLTEIRRLATVAGTSFYVFEFSSGRRCYDAVHRPKIVGGIGRCLAPSRAFPTPEDPVLDLSLVGADAGEPMHTLTLQGIAADGVASVGVLGSDGSVYGKTAVDRNVFVSTGLPPAADGPEIAYDGSGRVLWCFAYVPPRFPRSVLIAAGCRPGRF